MVLRGWELNDALLTSLNLRKFCSQFDSLNFTQFKLALFTFLLQHCAYRDVRLEDRTLAASLLAKLDLLPIETLVQQSRLRWYGHVQCSTDWINNVTTLQVAGTFSHGRPKKTWAETLKNDMVWWGLERVDPADRNTWRRAM